MEGSYFLSEISPEVDTIRNNILFQILSPSRDRPTYVVQWLLRDQAESGSSWFKSCLCHETIRWSEIYQLQFWLVEAKVIRESSDPLKSNTFTVHNQSSVLLCSLKSVCLEEHSCYCSLRFWGPEPTFIWFNHSFAPPPPLQLKYGAIII